MLSYCPSFLLIILLSSTFLAGNVVAKPSKKAVDANAESQKLQNISKTVSNVLESEEMQKVGQILETLRQSIIAEFGKNSKQQPSDLLAENGNDVDKLKGAMAASNERTIVVGSAPHQIAELNKRNGHLLYQSDIVLNVRQAEHLLLQHQQQFGSTKANNNNGRERRQAISASSNYFIWEDRIVPYTMDRSLTQKTQQLIRRVLADWEDKTCLTFQEQPLGEENEEESGTTTTTILFMATEDGCYSSVGKQVDEPSQVVSIGSGCEIFGIVSHEVAHALGFFHTQSRWDRDEYVQLNTQYLDKDKAENYYKESPYTNDNMQVPYDYGSVMHYNAESFSRDPNVPIMTALEPHNQNTMGQRYAPSFLDVLLMNKRYGCIGNCDKQQNAAKCENGSFPKPRDCSRCICPSGFGGQFCTQRQASSGANAKCGKSIQAKGEWASLSGSVGKRGSQVELAEPNACHWHIVAPQGKRVELQVNSVDGTCLHGCFHGNTELKTRADFTRTGFRICCKSDLPQDGLFLRSETNLAVVSLYSRLGAQSFALQYRYVSV